jgi:CRP-like cAMP-binding protein
MTGDPRSATVRAESEVKCYALGSTTVRDVLLSREDVVEEISAILATRQAARDNAHAAAGKEGATDDAHAILSRIRQFMGLARSEEP